MVKHVTHGLLVADKGVYPELKSAAAKAGWGVKSIPDDILDNVSDEAIAKKYGKGKCVLLTHDKTAYTHNVKGGFVGYIEYERIPEKPEFAVFISDFEYMISSIKISEVAGFRIMFYKRNIDRVRLAGNWKK